ncbi:MAG: hypothetical protein LBD09_03090 [Treponema sp.]|jgi:hypothetical protein|nr:hypothetical protein [Treponema sp.]
MKKTAIVFFLAWVLTASAWGQIFRCDGEGRQGRVSLTLQFVDYADYHYVLYIEGVSIFLDEENIGQLRAVLDKFGAWVTIAQNEQVSLTKTIGTVRGGEYHHNHTFVKKPLPLYFVFAGGPEFAAPPDSEERRAVYTLFIDSGLDVVSPFRLSREQAEAFLASLTPDKLAEARAVYDRQKALEELFR